MYFIFLIAETPYHYYQWASIKSSINVYKIQFIVKEYVPSKVIKSKFNVPWIDDEIRKLIKKRDRFRSRTKHRRWDPHIAARYRTMKAEIQRAIRTKYWKYVHFTLLGLQDPDETADTSAPVKNSKRFFSFLKSQRSESCGVSSPVRNEVESLRSQRP